MNFAYIKEDKVVLVVEADSIEELLPLDKQYSNIVELSEFSPEPKVGWYFENNKFRNPSDNSSPDVVTEMKITKLAMLQRFTMSERLAILNYVQLNPVSVPAVLLQNIQVTAFVDLKRPDTISGISYLVYLNIITQSRANEILNNIPSDIEIYKG